jgi:uncharacterized OsmC-like protein
MSIRIKPKSFGPVFVSIDAARNVRYGLNANAVDQATPPAATPAECLLSALGSCIAISLQMAAEQQHLVLAPFQVEVSSKKAEDLPIRFGSFEVIVSRGITDDAEDCEKLLRKVKDICTVSNTLNAAITLKLSE